MFINAMASLLNVSPGAIEILRVKAVEQGTRRRRRNTLAATNSSVAVEFKVELTFFEETETVKESLVTTDPEKITEIKTKLTDEGLTNMHDTHYAHTLCSTTNRRYSIRAVERQRGVGETPRCCSC